MLSKNTSSSRAIPFNKMVEAVQNNPFIPIAWQKEHKGMQGSEYFTEEEDIQNLRNRWEDACTTIREEADTLYRLGVTKQLCNRLLEPFMWTTMLITGSREGWDNFFNLRCPNHQIKFNTEPKTIESFKTWKEVVKRCNVPEMEKAGILQRLYHNKGQAEIHMMALAESIYDAVNESKPIQLKAGEWHIPFEDKISPGILIYSREYDYGKVYKDVEKSIIMTKVKVSVAMAARTSYTVVGEEKGGDYEAMIGLHNRLLTQEPPHSSPFEHTARAMNDEEYFTNVKGIGFKNGGGLSFKSNSEGWCYNLKGFISYRYLVDNNITI
jgi:hypothetical protein